MNTKRWFLLAIMFLVMLGCNQAPAVDERATVTPENRPAPTPVRTGATILADGIIQSAQPVLPLAFDTSGKLRAVHVQAGDLVQEGDILAELEEAESLDAYQAAVAAAELTVLRAEQALDALYANAEIARTNALNEIAIYAKAVRDAQYQLELYILPAYLQGLDAIQALDQMKDRLDAASAAFEPHRFDSVDNPARQAALQALNDAQSQYDAAVKRLRYEYELQVAQANLDKARSDYDKNIDGPSADELALAEAELAHAQAELTRAQEALERAMEAQDDIFLRAPWTGTVLSVEAAPGALVSPGAPALLLLDATQLQFHTTNLSERDLALIYPGQKALVTLKAYPQQPLEATVSRIGWQAGSMVGDAVTFPVIFELGETGLDLRPGMTGRVEIQSGE